MSARTQRVVQETTTNRRFVTPRLRNKDTKPAVISYDYEAAISKPDISNFLDFKKKTNFSSSMGRSPRLRSKSQSRKGTKCLSPGRRKETEVACYVPQEETGCVEKENVANCTNVIEVSLIIPKKDTEENVFHKDAEVEGRERIEFGKECQNTEKTVEIEKFESTDDFGPKSPVFQAKCSKIPRAKGALFPANAHHESHSAKRRTKTQKSKSLLHQTSNAMHFDFEKIVWNEEKTSGIEADEEQEADQDLTSTDESPTIIGRDPCTLTISRTSKLNYPCQSCTDQDPATSSRIEDDTFSDLRSSSPREIRKKRWTKPLKHRKYIDTSSEESDISSICSRENIKEKPKNHPELANSLKQSLLAKASPKISHRRCAAFSFFGALFDIVFWPYLFLRANR